MKCYNTGLCGHKRLGECNHTKPEACFYSKSTHQPTYSKELNLEKEKIKFYEELETALSKVGGVPSFKRYKAMPLQDVLDGLYCNGIRFRVEVVPK